MRRWFQIQLLALFISVAFFATYVLASSETNISSKRGEGKSAISGWNISSIQYHLASDPSQISSVEFDLDSSATQVSISFDSASDHAFTCYNVNSYHWLCDVSSVDLARLNSLRVIAIN